VLFSRFDGVQLETRFRFVSKPARPWHHSIPFLFHLSSKAQRRCRWPYTFTHYLPNRPCCLRGPFQQENLQIRATQESAGPGPPRLPRLPRGTPAIGAPGLEHGKELPCIIGHRTHASVFFDDICIYHVLLTLPRFAAVFEFALPLRLGVEYVDGKYEGFFDKTMRDTQHNPCSKTSHSAMFSICDGRWSRWSGD
jgi:hypothetical protein